MSSKEIKAPVFSESVSEASIMNLTVKPGDFVEEDQVICELETDKVSLEVTSPASGVIDEILFKDGDSVQSQQVIAKISPSDKPVENTSPETPKQSTAAPSTTNESDNDKKSDDYTKSSPSSRQEATQSGVDINSVTPSGPKSTVLKQDVTNRTAQSSSLRDEKVVKMTKLRKVISKRLKDTQNTAAILTTFNEVDMYNVINIRKKYKEQFEKEHGIKLGFMSFFVKAATIALQKIPGVNAEIRGDDIVYKNYCDISVAVSTEKGLFVPVLRNTEHMSFADVENSILDYAKKAKDGKLSMEDMQGGTFTITNGGTFGSMLSTPILNPPQSAILGMHATKEKPVVINGEIVVRPMMYLALSYDHRIIDGKEAVTFLKIIKEIIEDPTRLFLGL